jgi:hypothetical protein
MQFTYTGKMLIADRGPLRVGDTKDVEEAKMPVLLGFVAENVPLFEQNRKNPEKTCGNRRNVIDKVRRKDEGEMRYGSPHPHEH